MEKAAEETGVDSGPQIPGQTPPAPDISATAEGTADALKVPSAALVVPKGTSEVDTKPGAVGQEEKRPNQPGTEENPPSGEVAKLSSLLRRMASVDYPVKTAIDGASLSGGDAKGTAPTPRTDLSDNLDIPGVVAAGRGQTAHDIPASAMVGMLKKQPAGTPGPTAKTDNDAANDVAKHAAQVLRSTPTGRAFLNKLSEEACKEEEAEKKKEEDKKEEKKEAAVQMALQSLARAVL
jgi:hypothetical protein